MKIKSWLKITTFALLFSQLSIASAEKVYHFATEATYPPFAYVTPEGNITGFETELIMLLCKVQNMQCDFANQPFDSLIPSLKIGKYDAIYGGLDITPMRQKQVLFSSPLYENGASFISLTNTLHYPSMKGKSIGVQQGSTMQQYLQKTYGHTISIKPYASIQDAFLDLKSKRIDAVFGDTPILQSWQQSSELKLQVDEIPAQDQQQYFGQGYALAMTFKNKALVEQFNTSLKTIKTNGQLDALKAKYWPKGK